MSEPHVFDDLAGFALGILTAEESARVSAHVAVCDSCRKELATFASTSSQLAMAVGNAYEPAPALTRAVRDGGRGASQKNVAEAMRGSGFPKLGLIGAMRSILRTPGGLALGALVAVALILLGLVNLRLMERVKALEEQASSGYMQVIRLEGMGSAAEANGYVMVFREQRHGSLAVTHAPVLGADEQYQIWLVEDGVRVSGGVFDVNADGYGNLMVSADMPLGEFDSFGITVEPRGGSDAPTGEKVMGSE